MAISPPSPLLSARSTSMTYLSETMTVSVQKKIDRMPYTLSGVKGTWPGAEDFLDGIQDAGADVAVNNADGAHGEHGKR